MSETMYVVLEMETDNEGLIYDDQIGFLPVYRTLEDLREDYPDADYVCIREGRMQGRDNEDYQGVPQEDSVDPDR